jgi:holliday junction DNA helicase RuvA
MIAHISGNLLYRSPSHIIVDVQGVGYRIFISLTTFYEMPDVGQAVALHIHTHVKQDAIHLCGFLSPEERDIFQYMLTVNGIGPRLAINILSGISAGELLKSVAQGNVKRLTAIPGVGKKIAERLILELKDKMVKLIDAEKGDIGAVSEFEGLQKDALSALINLGYKHQTAKEALDAICGQASEFSLDMLLKQALKLLAG